MCGIAGLIGRLADGDADRLVAMTDCIAHRGPDSLGRHVAGCDGNGDGWGVMLGHRRLSIIDVRHIADQPMVDAGTGAALVFNGEIYNFTELRAELEALGRPFLTQGDSEVILQGWLAWGPAIVARLRGMFALVLHDPRSRTVLLARDGFGIKPLYYTVADGRLAFASEVRALLASGLAGRRIDRAAIARYLWNGFVAGPASLVDDVEELPAGSYALLTPDRPRVEPVRFWHPGEARPAPDLDADGAVAAIARSVELHLQADVPLGVFLSGGIDSTAVAALAARHRPDVRTMCIGFDDRATDESTVAAEVAKRLGTRHTTVIVHPDAMLADLDAALASLDQPTMDGINSWFVSRAARGEGWKVALSGAGGDELLGGYASFRRLPRLAGTLAGSPAAVRAVARGLLRLGGRGWGTASKLADLVATGGEPVRVYQALYALFSSANVARLTGADPGWGLDPAVIEALAADVAGLSPLRTVSAIEDRLFLGARLLRDTDAVSMAHSLEVRVPLVDTVLNDAMARLPDAARFDPVGAKPLLRRIAVEAAGLEPFARAKQGFVFPFETWLRGPLRAEVEAVLTDPALVAAAGLRVAATTALWRAFLAKPGRIYWTRVWAVFVLVRWCAINRMAVG